MERWQKERLDRARDALAEFIERAEAEREQIQRQIGEAQKALDSLKAATA